MRIPLPLLSFVAALLPPPAAAADAPPRPTLEFIENRGQWDGRARYAAPLPGGARLFAEADGLTFALLADGGPAQRGHGGPATGPRANARAAAPPADAAVRGHALRLRFEGAGPAVLTAAGPTAERRSYFLGNDPAHWAADVRGYRALRYAGLWPGVDARVYESADQHLEYDFELAAGADPAAIGLRHEGADGLALDAAGNLVVGTRAGALVERAPQAYQTDGAGRRRAVACRYVLAGPVLRFALGPYDRARPLTIDPVVVFATYSGSVADNWGFTATYDPQGHLYSGGIAFGVGYPASLGAFQTTFAALIDIALIKYNTAVSGPAARVWATYLGGAGADFPSSLVVNGRGELLLLGASGSANYPTTAGAAQRTFGGGTPADPLGFGAPYNAPTGSDLVITRLAANGAALVGSTYLGGAGNDGLLPLDALAAPDSVPQLAHNYGDPFRGDILVDAADNVYVASSTASANFPVARGLGGAYRGGTSDGVVAKLAPDLTALTWASYLGGRAADAAYSLQLEPTSGDLYVAGGTLSPDFPTTAGSYLPAPPGGVDGFAVRLSADGRTLRRATYAGTPAYDQAFFLQLGTDGGVYLLGQTRGAFPRSPGLFGTAGGTLFIQKFDADLGRSLLATAFGSTDPANAGRLALNPTAFLVDRCDRVYVGGWGGMVNGGFTNPLDVPFPYQIGNGTTAGLPTTPGAFQPTTDGSDFYLAQLAPGLTALSYGTYYGSTGAEGEHVDGGTSRFDPRGIVYQAVCACFERRGFPVPPGANTYSAANGSPGPSCNNAAFVVDFQARIADAGADAGICPTAGPQPLRGEPAGGVWTGPGVTGSVAAGFAFTPAPALVGTQVLTYTVASTGVCTTTATRRVMVTPAPDLRATWAAVACPETRLAPLALRFGLATPGPFAPADAVWDFGDGSQGTGPAPTHTYAAPGRYQPRLRLRYDDGRCEAEALAPPVEVLARRLPNVITPNADGQNDTFVVGPDCAPRLQVFSRWGQPVFDAAAYRDDWGGGNQPAGVYFYLLTYPDGARLKGWVEVVR